MIALLKNVFMALVWLVALFIVVSVFVDIVRSTYRD